MFDIYKNFLTIGDWSARVWSEDINESCLLWVNSGTEVKSVEIHIYLLFQMFRCLLMDAGVQPDLQYFSPPGLMAGWKLGTL